MYQTVCGCEDGDSFSIQVHVYSSVSAHVSYEPNVTENLRNTVMFAIVGTVNREIFVVEKFS